MPEVKPFLLRMNVNTVKLYDSKKVLNCYRMSQMKISQCHELLTVCKTVIHSCDNNSRTYYTSNFQENINYGWIEGKNKNIQKLKKYDKVGFRCDDFPYEWK